jgi:hypothetical protein
VPPASVITRALAGGIAFHGVLIIAAQHLQDKAGRTAGDALSGNLEEFGSAFQMRDRHLSRS